MRGGWGEMELIQHGTVKCSMAAVGWGWCCRGDGLKCLHPECGGSCRSEEENGLEIIWILNDCVVKCYRSSVQHFLSIHVLQFTNSVKHHTHICFSILLLSSSAFFLYRIRVVFLSVDFVRLLSSTVIVKH